MSTEEDRAKEAYKQAGVDLPDLEGEPKEDAPKEDAPKEPEEAPKAPEEEPKDEPEEHLKEPQEQRKRGLYDDLKSERAKRKQAEAERDEFRQKLEALDTADTPEERKEAADDLEAFAKEIGADPAALKRMRELFIKDVAPKTDEQLAKDLEEFKAWKTQNQQVIEKQLFEDEFSKVRPTLKEYFPGATEEEMAKVKTELDRISHTKEWHDKDLDYIAFKNKEALNAFVSPKKRGMESKGRKDVDEVTTDFDPEADLSKLSPKERAAWEKQYTAMSKTDSLVTDESGRRILI